VAALRVRLETWQTHGLEELDEIWMEEGRRVEAAVAFAESSPLPDPEEALQDLFFAADDNEKAAL
jgi:TPP-dependent pyruvate/acetoin dehydrogenase alpha subunit